MFVWKYHKITFKFELLAKTAKMDSLSKPIPPREGSLWMDTIYIEAISKPQIAFEGMAGADDKAQHTRGVCEHFEEALNTAIGR